MVTIVFRKKQKKFFADNLLTLVVDFPVTAET